MKRISALLPPFSGACFLLISLMLSMLAGAGPALAASGTREATAQAGSQCLAAAPAKQQVALGQPAYIVITVACYASIPSPALVVNWGDGNLSKYPLCEHACPVPPVTLVASHAYMLVGTYWPLICLVGTGPITPQPECVSVEVVVVAPTPQPLT
uniref:Ig-like domain-containing protein n=1 Tax=Thermogemmatispora argillosa TaxID=2045280 RepID=A0A455T0W5_9CHLR|nr:hypothetical protein KTA_12080 [Thermogemmatispora argillosa]